MMSSLAIFNTTPAPRCPWQQGGQETDHDGFFVEQER